MGKAGRKKEETAAAGVLGGGYGDDVAALARRHALLHIAARDALADGR